MMNLFQEIYNGKLNRIKELIEENGVPYDSKWTDYLLLRYAICVDQKEICKFLIEKGCRINRNCKSNTPLHIAVKHEQVDIVNLLLVNGASIDCKNANGETPLHFAARTRNKKIIDLILKKIPSTEDIEIENRGLVQLHIACMSNDAATVNCLLSTGVSIDDPVISTSPYWPSYTPLHFAVEYEDPDTTKVLLNYGAKITIKDVKGLTPLHHAVQLKNFVILDMMLSSDSNRNEYLNPKDSRGFSHFHAACMRNNPSVIKGFIERGVNINDTVDARSLEWPGYTPLHFSVENGFIETTELLLSYGADITIKNVEGLTPLHFAIQKDNKNIIDLILSAHKTSTKSINPVDNRGLSHFHAACMRNDPSVVKIFLQNGVEINNAVNFRSPNWSGYTALHFAVRNGCVETIKELLNYGSDINAKDQNGLTPLHLAITRFDELVVLTLLTSGADINATTLTGMTPLHLAIEKGSKEIVEILLLHNADVNCREFSKFYTPLHLATFYNHISIINLLLCAGADFHVRERDGKTALHAMALRDQKKELDMELVEIYSKIITLLQSWNFDVDSRDSFGRTPLHLTCLHRNLAGTYALLQNGADINVEDSAGKTPLSYCIRVFHGIKYILQDHIEKLRYINFYISEKNRSGYLKLQNSYQRLNRRLRKMNRNDSLITRCDAELKHMRRVRVDSYTSLRDIIFKDVNDMTVHVKNDRLKGIIESSDFNKDFSLYGYLIKLQVKRGMARMALMRPAKESIDFLFGRGLPDACSERVLKYLTNEHLHQLIAAKL